ncbi:MAG: hypothetical protein KC620_06870, partial [Myxococcales bacterium]|nr:hypothetical protein [Myxococcales bacterium]
RDSESGEQVQINCGVDDPGRGELILPADLVAGLPTNDDFRQLTVLWGIDRVDLPAPDPGSFTRSVALVLRLDL